MFSFTPQNLAEWIADKEEVEIVDLILKIKDKLVRFPLFLLQKIFLLNCFTSMMIKIIADKQ